MADEFADITDYRKLRSDNERFLKKQYDDAVKQGGSMKELALAAQSARHSIVESGLSPDFGEYGESIYSVEQGAKAACFAREDAAATLILQKTQLDHLHGIKVLLWLCFCLLIYISYRVS